MICIIRSGYYYFILTIVNKLLSGTRFFKIKRLLLNKIGIKVGDNSKVVGPLIIGRIAKLEIGANCWIGTNMSVYGNGRVIIGDNCDIAPGVSIFTGSHSIGSKERRAGKGKSYDNIIGNGTWIGGNTTIINGANIGNGVVLGACSLIIKDCEDNNIYFGHPAKKVREIKGDESS